MRVHCENCGTVYNLPEQKVSAQGTPVKCKICGHVFVVHRPEPSAGAVPEEPTAGAADEREPSDDRPAPPSAGRTQGEAFDAAAPDEPMRPTETAEPYPVGRPRKPGAPPEIDDDLDDFDLAKLRPAETWLKFVLGFAISIGAILLGYYIYSFTRQALDVWDLFDQQAASQDEMERRLAEVQPAKSAWDAHYDGVAGLEQATREGCGNAVEAFETALEMDPMLAAAHAGLAEALICPAAPRDDAAVVERADASAKKALDLDPKSVEGHRALGEIALTRGDVDAAQDAARRAMALEPNDGATHLLQAKVFLKTDQLDLAAESLASALSNNPLLLDAHFLMAQLHANRHDWAQAVEHARRAGGINPDHEEAARYLKVFSEQLAREEAPPGERREATRRLGPPVEPPPSPIQKEETYSSLMKQGESLQRRGALWDAVGRFQRASEMDPGRCEPHAALGFVYYDLNQPQAAKGEFERALTGGARCAHAHLGLASVNQDDGSTAKAIEHYEKFLRLRPSGPDAGEVRAILENLRRNR